MRITPLDVRKQEFKKVVRGLDPEEVYAFLATVADEYETVLTDNRQLRDRVLELDDKVVEYRNMEKTLRDTLMTAERVMAEARDNARKEAELILRDAKVQAQQDSQNTAIQAEALKIQLRELRSQRDAFLARLRGLAEAQIGMVDSFVKDFREDDRQLDLAPSHSIHEAIRPPASPVVDYPTPGPDPAPQYRPEMDAPAPEAQRVVDPDGPTRGYMPPESVDHWRDYQPDHPQAVQAPPSGAVERIETLVAKTSMPMPASPEDIPTPPEMPTEPTVDELASTVVEMAQAAGAQSGQLEESVPSYAHSGEEGLEAPESEQPEPAAVASAEESEESKEGSRWSISRFTRGLGDF